MLLPKPTVSQRVLQAILVLVVMLTIFSSVLSLHKHLTYVSTPNHQKEIRNLNGEEFISPSGYNWSNITPRSLSARMDGADDSSDERRIRIAANSGFQIFDALLNGRMDQSQFTLTSEARGNGPEGWLFAPPRQNHIGNILSQLSDSLLRDAYAHRDVGAWTNLDAAQDGFYLSRHGEHMVSSRSNYSTGEYPTDKYLSQQTLSVMA